MSSPQVHGAYHYALGLSRTATELVMFVLSILMLGSMHAVQINHLRHHRYCLATEDIDAMTYDMFYHVEHHLFPAVPTCRLPILAQRLDRAAPEFGAQKVF